ncbi:MAG: hypothetical protein ACK5AV_02520 [Alphaproteobacteria bacterium]
MIQRIYQNQYVKYVQIAAPSAIRLGLNYYNGQALSTGLIMPLVIGAISVSQVEILRNGIAKDKATIVHNILLNPIKHQLMSCLFYSALSTLGFDKHLTEFAATMCATVLYGSAFNENAKQYFPHYTIISDISKCFLGYMGLYSILGDSYGMPYLVSIFSQSLIEGAVVLVSSDQDYKDIAVLNLCNAIRGAFSVLLPMDGESAIISYMPEIENSLTSFIRSTVSAFTEAGLAA